MGRTVKFAQKREGGGKKKGKAKTSRADKRRAIIFAGVEGGRFVILTRGRGK